MATATRRWTLAEMHSLPPDANTYELIRGQLFVTPAPTFTHETILARLARILDRYVAEQGLGLVYRPRAILQYDGSETEPDIQVRNDAAAGTSWENEPPPILVVEAHSPSTCRLDQVEKRQLYADAGVPEYWMVDERNRSITVVRTNCTDAVMVDSLTWHPESATAPLMFNLGQLFG